MPGPGDDNVRVHDIRTDIRTHLQTFALPGRGHKGPLRGASAAQPPSRSGEGRDQLGAGQVTCHVAQAGAEVKAFS